MIGSYRDLSSYLHNGLIEERLFRPETPLWWLFVAAGASLLVLGGAAAVWPAAVGLRRVGRLDLAGWLVLLPLYLLLVSAAAWRGLFELWRDPQGWNKTEHGLARRRGRGPASRPRRSAAEERNARRALSPRRGRRCPGSPP